jgi:hypothetical protein
MAAPVFGYSNIEKRVDAIRRRLNLLYLQQAFFVTGALILFSTSGIALAALKGSTTVFQAVLFATVFATAVAIGVGIFSLRQRWLSLEEAAHLVDRKAHLQDRLTTLCVQRNRYRSSLIPILVAQVLALAPQWDGHAVASRRLSRTSLLFASALAALVCTLWLSKRSTASPPPSPTAKHRIAQEPNSSSTTDTGISGNGGPLGAVASLSPQTGKITDRNLADTTTGIGHDSHHSKAVSLGNAPPAGLPQRTATSRERARGTNHSMSERIANVQDAIRAALGTTPQSQQRESKDDSTPGSNLSSHHHRPNTADPARDPGGGATASGSSPQPRGAQPGNAHGATAASSHLAGAAGTPLGQGVNSTRTGSKTHSFSLRLASTSDSLRTLFEKQKGAPDGSIAPSTAEESKEAPRISEKDLPDDPMDKTEISPEQEDLVRRIFRRDP